MVGDPDSCYCVMKGHTECDESHSQRINYIKGRNNDLFNQLAYIWRQL